MSRTFRRKNYEQENRNSWYKIGAKFFGAYTVKTGWWGWSEVTFRKPTKKEYWERYYWAHGESRNNNERSPGREYRNYRMRQSRYHDRMEIHRFMRNEEYEVMCFEEPISCLWDWR